MFLSVRWNLFQRIRLFDKSVLFCRHGNNCEMFSWCGLKQRDIRLICRKPAVLFGVLKQALMRIQRVFILRSHVSSGRKCLSSWIVSDLHLFNGITFPCSITLTAFYGPFNDFSPIECFWMAFLSFFSIIIDF